MDDFLVVFAVGGGKKLRMEFTVRELVHGEVILRVFSRISARRG